PGAASGPYADADTGEEIALRMAQDAPVEKSKHHFLDALKTALYAAGQEAREHPSNDWQGVARIAGAGGAGLAAGVVDSKTYPRLKHEAMVNRAQQRLDARNYNQDASSRVRLRKAQASALEARPELEASKAQAADLNRRRGAALRTLSMLRGQRLDENNPEHAKLLQELSDVGVHGVDPASWNDAKSNVMHLTATDENDPSKVNNVEFNAVTGEQRVIGQRGFQPPIGEDGLTETQRRADSDRDASRSQSDEHFSRAFGATQHQRAVQNDLARIRIGQGGERLDLARAAQDSRLDERTRAELKSAHRLQAELQKAQADADSYAGLGTYTGDDGKPHRAKWAVQKETDARNKAQALQSEFEGAYGYLMQDSPTPSAGGAPSRSLPHRGAPAAHRAASPSAGGSYTADEVRARARARGVDENAAVEAARAKGMLKQ
ncbi:MAG: hypothetical protein WCD76_03880, partial [Pyrinomonadaceae bacterium]